MSEVAEMKKLSDELKGTFEGFKASTLKIEEAQEKNSTELHGLKTAQDQQNEKMTEIEKSIESFNKQLKKDRFMVDAREKYSQDANTRKQFNELAFLIRKMGADNDGALKMFNSANLKSYIAYRKHRIQNEVEELKSYGYNEAEIFEMKKYKEGADEFGGIFVIPEMDALLDKLVREYSVIRSIASTRMISSDTWTRKVSKQNNGAKRKKDMSDFTTATKQDLFGDVTIKVEDLYAIALLEDNLINDSSFDIVADLLQSIAEDFAITEGTEFISGDGVGEMLGITDASIQGAAGSNEFDKIARELTASASTIKVEDLINMQMQLKEPYRSRGAFYMNRLIISEVRKLRSDSGAGAGTGEFLWQPSVQAGVPATLLGMPVIETPELGSVLTTGTVVAACGDMRSGYMIVDNMGVQVTRDPLTSYPDIAYKVKKRSGGGLVKGEAIKLLATS
jgi:HK97 family phage major capsid protein